MKYFLLLLFFYSQAHAVQELETVVRETKFNSSSRVIISKLEIEKSRVKNVSTLLATLANVSIVQSNFTPTSIFMRGGDSGHILILIDGVPVYDSSSVQRNFNINSIDIKSIQRIEVIRGSQSVLYGGQALTGVIKIDTIPVDLKSTRLILLQRGNFDQRVAAAGMTQQWGDHTAVIVRGNYSDKNAASPVLDSTQKYPTKLGTAEVMGVYRGAIDATIKLQTAYDQTYISTTDNSGFNAADADNFITSTYQHGITGIISSQVIPLKPILSCSRQLNARQFEQDAVAGGGSQTKQDYQGQLSVLRLDTTPFENAAFNIKVGGSFNSETMIYRNLDVLKTDEQDEFEGAYLKNEVTVNKDVIIELGARADSRRMKNAINTYQAGLSLLEMFKLEFATGFKQPSLFQLYSAYGNPNLNPERSTNYSVSFEKRLAKILYFSVTAFQSRFENLIIARGTPVVYENVSNSETRGVELWTSVADNDNGLTVNISLGYQEPKDLDQGVWLPRRPLRTASLVTRKDFDKLSTGFEILHNGDRRDRTGSSTYGTLVPYTLVNLTGEYRPIDSLALFTRIQNLGNQRYESNYSFHDEGLNIVEGIEYTF